MYTLEQLQQKTFKELKEIGRRLNVLPAGDKRCRQNWIEAIVGINPPLLELLETSRAADESVEEAIAPEIAISFSKEPVFDFKALLRADFSHFRQMSREQLVLFYREAISEPISLQTVPRELLSEVLDWASLAALKFYLGSTRLYLPDTDSFVSAPANLGIEVNCHFSWSKGRMEYEATQFLREGVFKTYCDDFSYLLHFTYEHFGFGQMPGDTITSLSYLFGFIRYLRMEPDSDELFSPLQASCPYRAKSATKNPPGATVDRVSEPIDLGRITGYLCRPKSIEIQATEPIAIFNDEQPPNRGDGRGGRLEQTPVTFSDRFLATYPPYFGEVSYKADATGQLNLLEPDIEDEPPDPDDFDSLDAFCETMAAWDAEHPELPEVSLDSFREWAPCPEEWFIPDTNETNETVSCTLEIPPVSVFSSGADESSSTSNFFIPVFGVAGDRANRNEEPPTAGVGARLPRPKPPSFPPMGVIAGDRSSIEKFARRAILLSGRDPPGGDAAHSR